MSNSIRKTALVKALSHAECAWNKSKQFVHGKGSPLGTFEKRVEFNQMSGELQLEKELKVFQDFIFA
jgi:hypothetical protein